MNGSENGRILLIDDTPALHDDFGRTSEILEFLPDATFVVDSQGKVIAWNRAIELMTGVRQEEMLGRGELAYGEPFYGEHRKILIDMLDEPDLEVQQRHYPGIRREGKTLFAEARVMLRGEVRHIWSSATVLYSVQGDKLGRIQSLRDITDLRRSEQERSSLEAQLHHSTTMEALMRQLGHDLKTPLTPLFALLPLVSKKVHDPELTRMLEICQQSVQQIEALSGKALELVRLSCRQAPLKTAPVSLKAALECSLASCAPLFSQRGVRCLNQVAESVVVQGAAEQLHLLLDNLLSNAARFAALNGRVRVSAVLEGETAVVSVCDDGVGLSPGQAVQIFDEFFKVDAARNDLNTQGLGLAICKRIVANHQGRIWAESAGPGQGTTVRFSIALADTHDRQTGKDGK